MASMTAAARPQRVDDLRRSVQALRPILRDHGLTGLVEPLGFEESSLRLKRVAVDAIDAVGVEIFSKSCMTLSTITWRAKEKSFRSGPASSIFRA